MQKDSVHLAGGKTAGAVASPANGDMAKQVGAQCNAVAHMAEALARVHQDYAAMIHAGHGAFLLNSVGKGTAELMELLGDILNGMDAVTEEDEWMDPIFAKARELWPNKSADQNTSCFYCSSDDEATKDTYFHRDCAGCVERIERQSATKRLQLNAALNPRLWTREMNEAWHRALPDLYAAFEALREAALQSGIKPNSPPAK